MANRHGHEANLILINATVIEETRVAITNGLRLENIFVEGSAMNRNGNLYKGKITRVVPSLQAAFVDFGSEKHGFLPLKEIAPHYFRNGNLMEGQEVIVQVAKEERGNKGAALTTFITLAGCYLVLMPNNPEAGGISRRIEGEDRELMREYINALTIPEGMGLIIRTAGLGRAKKEIEWDLDILLRLWQAILTAAESKPAPFLIHQESDIVIRALRDYLRPDISEILIDSPELYERAKQHITKIRPEFATHIRLYQDKTTPLFIRYGIESQIESAFSREVKLPSGGSIVIEVTEAMVTIDVNSAKDTKGGNIEQTAFNTNREAAIEIARQLRLRDIGGLIAIDFIDMMSNENQQKVVDTFREETVPDKARVQFNRISRFGILEVSRQRLRPSLNESSQIVCPRCDGQGSIRAVESLSLLIMRLIQQESLHDNVVGLLVHVPIDVATFLANEKRHALFELETQHRVLIRILPTEHLLTPHYRIERLYDHQVDIGEILPSFTQLSKTDPLASTYKGNTSNIQESKPILATMETETKHSVEGRKSGDGLLTRLWQKLACLTHKEEITPPVSPPVAVSNPNKERHSSPSRPQRHSGQGQQYRDNPRHTPQRQDHRHRQRPETGTGVESPSPRSQNVAYQDRKSSNVKYPARPQSSQHQTGKAPANPDNIGLQQPLTEKPQPRQRKPEAVIAGAPINPQTLPTLDLWAPTEAKVLIHEDAKKTELSNATLPLNLSDETTENATSSIKSTTRSPGREPREERNTRDLVRNQRNRRPSQRDHSGQERQGQRDPTSMRGTRDKAHPTTSPGLDDLSSNLPEVREGLIAIPSVDAPPLSREITSPVAHTAQEKRPALPQSPSLDSSLSEASPSLINENLKAKTFNLPEEQAHVLGDQEGLSLNLELESQERTKNKRYSRYNRNRYRHPSARNRVRGVSTEPLIQETPGTEKEK